MTSENKTIISETIKKSSLNAKDKYDYKKLELPKKHFIDMDMEIKEEDIVFNYNISELLEVSNLRKEDLLTKLRFLISVSELEELTHEYELSLEPENLYYGKDDQVKIKMRDIEQSEEPMDLHRQYKALIGYTWQDKYTYEDYLKGGMQLLGKDKFLKNIFETNSIKETVNVLKDKFDEVKLDIQENKMLIDKNKYKNQKRFSTITMVILLLFGIYISYLHIRVIPIERASANSGEAYIKEDYVEVIDSLEKIKIKDMGKTQKFILASSYIRSENLTDKQREIIFKNISLDGNEEILDYWIHLGRNELENSVNIAMKLSEDEILLYAYMKQLDQLERDTTMDGDEKNSKIKEIEEKMKPLIEKLEKYEDSEEDS